MTDRRRAVQFAGLAARTVLALALLVRGARKLGALGGMGIGAYADRLAAAGLPWSGPLAWVFALAELLAGLTLAVGAFHRTGAALAIAVLGLAIWVHHSHAWSVHAGGAEYAVALAVLAIQVWVHGPGGLAWKVDFKRHDHG